MLNEPTMNKLRALRLDALAAAWTEQSLAADGAPDQNRSCWPPTRRTTSSITTTRSRRTRRTRGRGGSAVAMTTMLFTRLPRSASSATGMAPRATVTDTTETRAPSCLSDRPQSVFMYGNNDTITWRSM